MNEIVAKILQEYFPASRVSPEYVMPNGQMLFQRVETLLEGLLDQIEEELS